MSVPKFMLQKYPMLPVLTPSDFIALANQTLDYAYPGVTIEGEVLNYKVSRGRWVYFDIADESAKIRCFGTVYVLPAPLEDGMTVRLTASPRLHAQFGFSLNLQALELSGEGSIKKASDLLRQKLEGEGLFDPGRKRNIPYPPEKIGLVTSEESAAYKDFIKVLSGRYGGIEIDLANVQVQGDAAVSQVVRAVEWFNKQAQMPDVIVVIRGGGSADDLQAFSSEQVTRAIAASRIPTMVAIGHEVDISLAELAADVRASTPSNAAELLVPDRRELRAGLAMLSKDLDKLASDALSIQKLKLHELAGAAEAALRIHIKEFRERVVYQKRTLDALSPQSVLKRGYAVVRYNGKVIKHSVDIQGGADLDIQFSSGNIRAKVQ